MQQAGKLVLVQVARVVAGDDDDGDVAGADVGAELLLNVTAGHVQQREIENDDVRRVLFDPVERVPAVFHRDDLEARVPENRFIELAQRRIIFDDENSGWGWGSHAQQCMDIRSVPKARRYPTVSGMVLEPSFSAKGELKMSTFRRKAAEQEIKGTGQKLKGVGQEIAGRLTGDDDLRARGEANQVGGHVRSRLGEAGRKISGAVERERTRRRR